MYCGLATHRLESVTEPEVVRYLRMQRFLARLGSRRHCRNNESRPRQKLATDIVWQRHHIGSCWRILEY